MNDQRDSKNQSRIKSILRNSVWGVGTWVLAGTLENYSNIKEILKDLDTAGVIETTIAIGTGVINVAIANPGESAAVFTVGVVAAMLFASLPGEEKRLEYTSWRKKCRDRALADLREKK